MIAAYPDKKQQLKVRIMNLLKVTILAAALGWAGSASAMTVWNLAGVSFDDGGTASGSFAYDAASNAYSNINLVTTAGAIFPGTGYSAFQAGNGNTLQVANGLSVLQLAFVNSLTALGGTVALGTNSDGRSPFEGLCTGSVPCRQYSSVRNIVSGAVTTDALSLAEPGTWVLMLAGLTACVFLRRRPGDQF